jgi:hypothetical protein
MHIYNKINNCLCIKGLIQIKGPMAFLKEVLRTIGTIMAASSMAVIVAVNSININTLPDQGSGKPENRSVVASIYKCNVIGANTPEGVMHC